jgi:Zn-dependent protease
VFSVFGFPVRISPFFFLVCALLNMPASFGVRALMDLAVWIAIVTFSVLWHELGHAFAMRRYGYSPSIELYGMGGLTRWSSGIAPTPKQRLVVSLAGPFAGFAIGFVVLAFAWIVGDLGHPLVSTIIEDLLWVNIGWGILNLVPMVPWDGGHAVHAFLDIVTNGRGAKPAALVTLVVGVGLLAFLALYGTALGADFAIWSAILVILSLAQGFRMWRAPAGPQATKAGPASGLDWLRDALHKAGPDAIVAHVLAGRSDPTFAKAAKAVEKDALGREVSIGGRAHALELAAWGHLLGGSPELAARTIERMPTSHAPSALLEALLSAKRGSNAEVLEIAAQLDGDDEDVARRMLEAHALIALGRSGEAASRAEGAERAAGAFVVERLFSSGSYDASAKIAGDLFERFRDPEDAYNAACAHARAGRPIDGLAWVERAIESGYRDVEHLEADEDLASVRSLPEFAELRDRARTPRAR